MKGSKDHLAYFDWTEQLMRKDNEDLFRPEEPLA